MSDVSQYVTALKEVGLKSAPAPSNGDDGRIRDELIAHYKDYPDKANELIKQVEEGKILDSKGQTIHYQCAVIAVKGYAKSVVPPTKIFAAETKETEIKKLTASGWRELLNK